MFILLSAFACCRVFVYSSERWNSVTVMNTEWTEIWEGVIFLCFTSVPSPVKRSQQSHPTLLQGHIIQPPPAPPSSASSSLSSSSCSLPPLSSSHLLYFLPFNCTCLQTHFCMVVSWENRPKVLMSRSLLSFWRHGVWEGDPDPSHHRGGIRCLRPDDGGNRDGLLAVFPCPHLQQHSQRHPGWPPQQG